MNRNNSKEQNNYLTCMVNGKTLQNAHGTIHYGMTNDYMFRAVLQSNNKVLRGLICALIHLSEKEIRSVIYLCRSFDSLTHEQDYSEAGTVIHIGFLDYTLFADCPEFYASYKLINVKSHQTYSDKITLNVVDLFRIDLATEEDRRYHIDYWATLFKATTWEEIKMLASKDEYLNEASETIFRLSADEQIRKQCRDREEHYQDMRSYEKALSDYKKTLAEQESLIAEHAKVIKEKDVEIQMLRSEIEQLKRQK